MIDVDAFYAVVGDTEGDISSQLSDDSGLIVMDNVTDVVCVISDPNFITPVIEGVGDVIDAVNAIVSYAIENGLPSSVGTYTIRWKLTYLDGLVSHFPSTDAPQILIMSAP